MYSSGGWSVAPPEHPGKDEIMLDFIFNLGSLIILFFLEIFGGV